MLFTKTTRTVSAVQMCTCVHVFCRNRLSPVVIWGTVVFLRSPNQSDLWPLTSSRHCSLDSFSSLWPVNPQRLLWCDPQFNSTVCLAPTTNTPHSKSLHVFGWLVIGYTFYLRAARDCRFSLFLMSPKRDTSYCLFRLQTENQFSNSIPDGLLKYHGD